MWLNILGEVCAVIMLLLGMKIYGPKRFVVFSLSFLVFSVNTFSLIIRYSNPGW